MDNTTAGNSMMDEFGDYSFFQDIEDIDENGNVIVNSNNSKKSNDDNKHDNKDNKDKDKESMEDINEGSMEDEFGDDSFLANVDIDDKGNVVDQKQDEQHGSKGSVPTGAVTTTPTRNESRSQDEKKRVSPGQGLVTARSLLHRKKLDDSSDEDEEEDVNASAARHTGPKKYSYSQEARPSDAVTDSRTMQSPEGIPDEHELDSSAAMKALGSPETIPVPEMTDVAVDFWEPSSWGSPQRKRPADTSDNSPGVGIPTRSPASVLVNPYSPRKKRMIPPKTPPRKTTRGGSPSKKSQGEPERFIVYG